MHCRPGTRIYSCQPGSGISRSRISRNSSTKKSYALSRKPMPLAAIWSSRAALFSNARKLKSANSDWRNSKLAPLSKAPYARSWTSVRSSTSEGWMDCCTSANYRGRRSKHPSEVLEEGKRYKFASTNSRSAIGKISLSYRSLQDHPWTISKSVSRSVRLCMERSRASLTLVRSCALPRCRRPRALVRTRSPSRWHKVTTMSRKDKRLTSRCSPSKPNVSV